MRTDVRALKHARRMRDQQRRWQEEGTPHPAPSSRPGCRAGDAGNHGSTASPLLDMTPEQRADYLKDVAQVSAAGAHLTRGTYG